MASPVAVLIDRLVSSLNPGLPSEAHADRCALANEILSCRVQPRIVLDAPHVQQAIHCILARHRVDPREFDELCSGLMQVSILQRPASILYVLCSLAFDADTSYVTTSITQVLPILTATESVLEPAPEPIIPVERPTSPDDECERALVRDAFFIVQAASGDTLKFSTKIRGNIKAPAEFPSESVNLVRALSTLGATFKKVSSFVSRSSTEIGRVQQAFISAVQAQVTLYYRLLAVLEAQNTGDRHLTLRQLYVWMQRPLKCMVALASIVDVVDQRQGSSMLSLLESACRHGDPYIHDVYETLLCSSSQPLFDFIRHWIWTGELRDPYNEFFVVENKEVSRDSFWTDQYTLRKEQIPIFLGADLAKRILSLGKSVQFIRLFGDQPKWMADNKVKEIAYGDKIRFESVLDGAAASINERVLNVVREQCRFMAHCTVIKNYILMAQGDYVENLMDLMFHELSQPAQTLYRHHLNSLLDSAVRAANPSTYDHSDELQRLCVRLLQANPGDTGWDVFTLDYNLHDADGEQMSALGIMFPPALMRSYLQVFNFMLRIKRIDHSLSDTWKRYNTDAALLAALPKLGSLLHRGHILRHEMVQLINNLSQFIRYDVIENCWSDFTRSIEAAQDFDAILAAHLTYVSSLRDRLFIGDDKSLQIPIFNLCDCILRFCYIQTRLHDAALEEITIQKSSKVGALQRVNSLQAQYEPQLDRICGLYRDNLSKLMDLFHNSDLRYLAFRLDFNGFYNSTSIDGKKPSDFKERR